MDREIDDEEGDENFGAWVVNPNQQVEEHEGTTIDTDDE
jgi:hypothetical protein